MIAKDNFMFQLTTEELTGLKCQIGTSRSHYRTRRKTHP
jgi:hypothetical protein